MTDATLLDRMAEAAFNEMIAGLESMDPGRIRFDDEHWGSLPPGRPDHWRKIALAVARVALSERCTFAELDGALDEKQAPDESMYHRIFRGIAKVRLASLTGAGNG